MSKCSKIIIWNVCLYLHMWTRLWIVPAIDLKIVYLQFQLWCWNLGKMSIFVWLSTSWNFNRLKLKFHQISNAQCLIENQNVFTCVSVYIFSYGSIKNSLFSLSDISLYKEQNENRIQLWRCLKCRLFFFFLISCLYMNEIVQKWTKGFHLFQCKRSETKHERFYFYGDAHLVNWLFAMFQRVTTRTKNSRKKW